MEINEKQLKKIGDIHILIGMATMSTLWLVFEFVKNARIYLALLSAILGIFSIALLIVYNHMVVYKQY